MGEQDRAEGALLGLACGDALGRPVEFHSPKQIDAEYGEITEMVGNGTHGKPAGTITDDTDQALCIARSLAKQGQFDPADIAERFVAWYNDGPFDVGVMTADALRRIDKGVSWESAGQEVWEERSEGSNAGNGSVMRCAPLALAFADDWDMLQQTSRDSSRITHADPRCTHGCAALNLTIAALLDGDDQPLATALGALSADAPESLRDVLEPIPDGIEASELSNSGFVLHTLQTGLYHALTADDAKTAIVNAVSEGGDTDTIGAVAGAVAGSRFGAASLPDRWTESIDETSRLRKIGHMLFSLDIAGADANGSFVVDGTEIERGTTKRASAYTKANIGHRPDPVPTQVLDKPSWKFTSADAAFFDWERHAYLSSEVDGADPDFRQSSVRVPEYALANSFNALPLQEQERIRDLHARAVEAVSNVEAAVRSIREPMIEQDFETADIPPRGQITSVTRQAVGAVGTAKQQLESPETALEAAGTVAELQDDANLLVDMLSWGLEETHETATLRDQAVAMLGEAQLALSTLRSIALRHPEIDAEKWDEAVSDGYLL
ncbi:ADP-ribosylglycohydrolase family protein [Halococcus sp. PRR34]|uniref:ADP-ribosylglycohydrolase family protein n=1 Tax=Halococcus sp. PRR34 TaxID=3020830 RepID=UPI003081194D